MRPPALSAQPWPHRGRQHHLRLLQASSTTHEALVHVPTQSEIPVGRSGGHTRSMKMAFSCGPGWVSPRWPWRPPVTPWLNDPGWATLGDVWETEADLLLLHENFADITTSRSSTPLSRHLCCAARRRRCGWRSPRRQFRSPGRMSLRRFPPGRRSFSDCRPTPNTSSMSRALS